MSAPKQNVIPQFFPCTTQHMSWDDWNGNLAIYYSQEHIMFQPEENWRQAAQHMASLATFQPFPLPNPEAYENWQDWANEFTLIVNKPNA